MDDDLDYDEYSDPNNPRRIKYEDIAAASRHIAGAVMKTPCGKAHMSNRLGMEIYFKQEFMQRTGCFKERGVRNALTMLSEDQKKNGVITAGIGNHAICMSYHASQLGISCVVVFPIGMSMYKATKCEQYGAKTILHGTNINEAKIYAIRIARDKRMTYINGYDHPNIIEGQGTIGIEIIEEVPNVDAVLVPVGGGSLLCGIAVAIKQLKPDTEIYGVETDKTCSMLEALRKNERTQIEIETTIADGLAVPMVGVNTFYNIKGSIDKMIVVTEDWVTRAILHIVEEERFVAEGAAAVTVAAIMAGLFPNLKGKKVVCVLTGGNINTTILARALDRGLAAEGRLIKFKVTVNEHPDGIAELSARLAAIGASIRDCIPERAWVKGDIYDCELKVVAMTKDWNHTKELMETIKKHYKNYVFQNMNTRTDNTAGVRRGPCLAPNPICMEK